LEAKKPLSVLRAGVGDTVKMIPVEEVCYFRADDKYTAVVTKDGEALIRIPLKDLLAQLDPARFARIHRGTIVNLSEVAAATHDELDDLVLAPLPAQRGEHLVGNAVRHRSGGKREVERHPLRLGEERAGAEFPDRRELLLLDAEAQRATGGVRHAVFAARGAAR